MKTSFFFSSFAMSRVKNWIISLMILSTPFLLALPSVSAQEMSADTNTQYVRQLRDYQQQVYQLQSLTSQIPAANANAAAFAQATDKSGLTNSFQNALETYINAMDQQLNISTMQLNITASSPLASRLNMNVSSQDITRITSELDQIRISLGTATSPNELAGISQQIKSVWSNTSTISSKTSALFLADYANRLLIASEQKHQYAQNITQNANANGQDTQIAQQILSEMKQILSSANQQFDGAVATLSSQNISQGKQQLGNVQGELKRYEQQYRYWRIEQQQWQ